MKEFQPLVSVIINCFNGEAYLRETIDSVIAQTYTNWEIVFWDNQSIDSTSDIVKSYDDDRIHYYYAPIHTTLGKARNLAVKQARGEYVCFLDSDDVWHKDKLCAQIKLLKPGQVEVVFTPYTLILGRNRVVNNKMYQYYNRLKRRVDVKSKSMYDNLLEGNFIIFSSVIFSKKMYVYLGGVDERFQQNEDYDILLKFSLNTEFKCTLQAYTFYRIHESNNSLSNEEHNILENRIIFDSLPTSSSLKKAKIANEIRYSLFLYKEGFFLKAIKHFLKCGDFKILLIMVKRKYF